MTSKILRARLFSGNIDNPSLQVKFYNQNFVSMRAGTLTKELANTKDVLFSRRDGRGQLPFYSISENGSMVFTYVVSKDTMSQIIQIRNKIQQMSTMLKQGRGIDVDELVKLEYEMPNDLSQDSRTRQGQLKRYAIVLDMKEKSAGGDSDTGYYQGGTNLYSDGEVQITCLPFTYGIKEQYGYTDSPIMAMDGGTLIGNLNGADTVTNYIVNPSFSADVLMENWAYNTAELNIQRLSEEESLLDNDIVISNLTSVSFKYLETSITGQTGDFFFFALVKRFDSGPPASFLSLDGVQVPTTKVRSPYKDYWLLFIKFNRVADFTCGFAVSENEQIIVAHTQLTKGNLSNVYPYPFLANGDLLGHKWSGVRHASTSELEFTIRDGVTYEDVNWLQGKFAINMWFTPLWEIPLNSLDAVIFRYTNPNNPAWSIKFSIQSLAFGVPYLAIAASGMGGYLGPIDIDYNKPIMFTVVKGGVGSMRIFINGVLLGGTPAPVQERDLVAGGTFELGKRSNMIFDAFRVFDRDLLPDEILNLYNDGLAIKEAGGNLANGIPSFYAYPQGQAGGMDGYNIVGGVQVTTKNHIAILGTNGDGVSDVNMRLESVGSVSTNRLVLNIIPTAKQAIYGGNFYLDLQGTVASDPNNDYGVNMESASPRIVDGTFDKNSLQPGETFTGIFRVGLGGQPVYNVYPKATQRPKLLSGKLTMLVRFLHVSPSGSSIISRPVFGYGNGTTGEIYDYKEIGDIGSNYIQVAYSGLTVSLKSFDDLGKDSSSWGMKFVNNGPNQSFLALDIIHLIKDPKIYLFNGLTGGAKTLALTTNKPCLVEGSDGYIVNRGSIVSQSPLVIMPSKYVYVGFDWSTHTFNERVIAQGEEVRKRAKVKLFLTPSYKF